MAKLLSQFSRALISAIVGSVMTLVASAAEAQDFRTGARFWSPPRTVGACRSSYEGIGGYSLSETLTRAPYPNDDAVNFAAHFGMRLADAIGGRNTGELKKFALQAAASRAYTKANHSRGWSPIYVQSNLIRLNAMTIILLHDRGLLEPQELRTLIVWGDQMIPGQKGSRGNKSSDSLLASGVAMLAWGNVKGDRSLMRSGYQKFMRGYPYVLHSVGRLRRHSGHRGISTTTLSLEDEYNVALQHAVEGVAILRNLGIDIGSTPVEGRTLHEAVTWWSQIIVKRPSAFRGYRPWSHNFHLGWIPIYLSMYPNRAASRSLSALESRVTAGRRPKFRAVSLGGATNCLW
jgi:hypothetical protein